MNEFARVYSDAFIKSIQPLHNQVNIFQDKEENEYIHEIDIVRALNILNYIDYQRIGDLFLGCAAINLVNAYMRQPDKKLNYMYKIRLIELLRGINKISDNNVVVSYDASNHMQLLIINFSSFQFSFQASRFSELTKFLSKGNKVAWDGIRKQKCALTIFEFALNNIYISNCTRKGKDLREFLELEIKDYHAGYYVFKDGDLLKKWNFASEPIIEDEYLKNYMRIKLCEPRQEPVILLGTFVKVWDKHVTFIDVRPYIIGIRAIPLCDHINLKRETLEKYVNVDSLDRGNIYFIIGYCKQYHDGSGRMGVTLAENVNCVPFVETGNLRSFDKNVFEKCYTFSAEEYTSRYQKYIKL